MVILAAAFLCPPAVQAWGQQGSDSALLREVRAAFRTISRSPDSALLIAQKGLARAQQTGNKRLLAYSYKTSGWAWLHRGNGEKAFPDLLQATELFRNMHDTLEEMYMYVNLGMAYSMHSQFANGAVYLLKADSLTRMINDPTIKAEVQRQMGILYREQGQYKKAITAFRKSMDMYWAARDTLYFLDAASSLSIVYMNMKLPDSSLALLNRNLPLVEGLRGYDYQKAMMQERFGDAYYAQARYDEAMESYGKAYRIFGAENNRADMAYESMNLGKTYAALKKYREAQNYLLISYRINDSLKQTNYAHDAAEQLASLYKATGDWRQAYHWLEKESELQDSLALTDENEKTAQLQAKYETEKKDEEISLLKKDQELNRAIVQRQRAFQYGTILLGLLLALVGLLAVNRYRAVQRAARIIEMEKIRNTIARDLHDDMGSALSSINIISKVALENAEEKLKVNEHLRKIHENSGFMLENISDIVWTIDPVNDNLEQALFKMKEFAADILEPLNIQYVFNQTGNFHAIRLGLQTRKNLYLVFKEAVNNAAKYSRCTRIDIDVSERERQISMQVRDNGIGFKRDGVRSGNGLKNMEERARLIGGSLTIMSEEGRGTTIGLRVKSHD
ncbi:MAG: ATP-binding protein [Bacteroidota bacterium]|nr:ATP-binding protein [Bacteroidota bacterium]MDP4216375.1 ATP-binding protein [Bacteroidota bacterium]MDP4244720.1 ATP-binding protein [Bacteroidota bacterium]